jgi:2-polyprenyl-3-methyl-5-hydroxy-6-metoxy-1,4-benzoquinol methylase
VPSGRLVSNSIRPLDTKGAVRHYSLPGWTPITLRSATMREALFAAHHALEERHWWFRARRAALREVGVSLLPAGGRVVDVGCGTGADLAAFPSSYDRHGVDQSATAIEFARSRHQGVRFEVATLPGEAAGTVPAADLILLCDVLEHVEDHEAFLRWLTSNMRPGAHLLLTVPADPRLWSPHDEAYGHHRRYTKETLSAVWAGEPVRVRLLAPFNRLLYPAARVARAAASRRGSGWGSDETDLALPWAPLNWVLEKIFLAEVPRIRRTLESGTVTIPGNGVSLMAVLQKDGDP